MKNTSINVITLMGQELARDISTEVAYINVKLASGEFTEEQCKEMKAAKKELNKQRIRALGMYSIPGGKE